MLPQFPEFKKLEISDREDVEKITSQYPPYSDFNFVSMWSWNITEEMLISTLNDNLVVRFNDYITTAPFYSFIGTNKVPETIDTIFEYLLSVGKKTNLALIPEEIVKQLDLTKFNIEEQRDHFDYIISVDRLMPHDGSERKLSSRRRSIKKFKETNNFEVKEIDLNDNLIQVKINDVFIKWELQLENGSDNVEHLRRALIRLLEMPDKRGIKSFGAYLNGELIGYSINEVCSNNYSVGHFQQGNVKAFPGIYALLMHETAPLFQKFGSSLINLEQDLDIPGLRNWKISHNPITFLKKYKVSYVDNKFVNTLFKRIIKI